MKVQRWPQERGPTSDQNLLESNDSSSTGNEEEPHKLNYSFINEYQLLRTRQLVFDCHAGRNVPHLREPRSLYAVAAGSPLHPPRWPIECEVIREQMHHIEWTPPEPEELYQPSQQEYMPACLGDEGRNMVFVIDAASKGSFFTFSRVGGRRGPLRHATIDSSGKDTSTLIFESRFESGNLQKATRIDSYEYELTLRTDLYTDKHTQWYYFRVQNMQPETSYRFTIVNLMKRTSLYNQGLKPLLYSEREAQLRQVGWHRVGKDIQYYKNALSQEGRSLYSLTWTCQFPHGNDTCYFAHSYPFTYSDLQRYLSAIASDPVRSRYCKLRVLCRSLAGNTVHVLTITSPSKRQDPRPAKRAVVVTARVHPGETNGSWVMTGFLDHILGTSDDARLLRDMFIFKVVPMLNPDGVVVGNYRCSLAGRDLNRNYGTMLRDCFPPVWHTRNMVQRLMQERGVVIYCDLHGHSRKNNVFMYGCSGNQLSTQRLRERVFPLMMSKNAADKFSYQSCKFKVQKSKAGTGRIVMWKMGIIHSYTMETTFAGSTLGNRKATHFSTEDLKSLGYHLCDTLLDFCDPDQSKFEQCLAEVRATLHQEARQRLERQGRQYNSDMTLSDLSISDLESSTSGSNSTGSDGLPAHLIRLAAKAHHKKKWLRSRKERNRLRQRHLLTRPSPPAPLRHLPASAKNRSEESESPVNPEKTGKAKELMDKVQLRHTHREQGIKPRPWIPNTTTGLSVICSMNTKNKTAWLEAMPTAYLRRQPNATPGQKYDQFAWDSGAPPPVTSQQRAVCQRHALPMSIVDRQQSWDPQQESGAPIKLHPLPFDAELACTDTLRQCLSDHSWRPGGLSLRRTPSATSATVNRSLSAYTQSSSRTLITNQQLTSKSTTPHLEELKLMAPQEVPGPAADGFTEVKPKPVTAAESGSPSGLRMSYTCSSYVDSEVPDVPNVGVAESATAGHHLNICETTSLPQRNKKQEICMGTDVPSRKNNKASPEVSKSPKMAQSGSRVQGSERGKRAPPVILSMATASLVSLDTMLEQNEGVNNVEDGLYKVPLEPHPSAPQTINPAVSRKRSKVQRLPKLSARANTLLLPKVVSGTTVAIHQPSRGLSSTRQLLDATVTEGPNGRRQALSRKSPELQEKDS